MEDRVAKLEGDMQDVKSVLSRLEPMIIRIDATLTATLPHLATRAEVSAEISGLRIEMTEKMSELRIDITRKLADLPIKTYMWAVLAVLIAAYGAGLAGLAIIK